MLKIAVIGSRETVMGFKAIGIEGFPVSDSSEARHFFRNITRAGEEYAIVYIEENLALALDEEINKFKDMPIPAIILIPGRDGPLGLGQSALKAAVERAVGSDVL